DDLVARADIVDVVGSRVPLKKKGKEYTACCPFHHEKSPSFFVSPEKQFYHCFGCGAHGTALGFLMAHDRLDFVEAVETLAGHMGMEVPREGGNTPSESPHAPLLSILEDCAKYYQGELKRTPKAVDYLKHRGVSGEIAAIFGLGYAPSGYDTLERVFNADDSIREQLKRAGMLSEGEQGRVYDRFRERIMFPIRDRRGRVIAFGGRVLNDDKPKYLNSPETPLFHKGNGLYGLYEARKALGRPERLLVVEGYMDVVMLAQHGVREAVATLGTAVTREQVDLMYRNTAQVIFCFDGDEAGRRAAWRALESTLPQLRDGLDARFMFLPDGEDPDSLVRQEGAEAFRKRIQTDAVSFDHFMLSELEQQTEQDGSPAARAKLKSLALPLIQLMPDSTLKDLVFDALTKHVGTRISRLPNTVRAAKQGEEKRKPPAASRNSTRHSAIRQAILLLLHHPELASERALNPAWANSTLPGFNLLHALVSTLCEHPAPLGVLLERFRNSPHAKALDALACLPEPQGSDDVLMRQKMWHGMLDRLNKTYADARWDELMSKPHNQLTTDERHELLRLSQIKSTS
ncbi:MAG TPA: DNA primase, partial [bacterium]|nr:DNA primase [bacterium]